MNSLIKETKLFQIVTMLMHTPEEYGKTMNLRNVIKKTVTHLKKKLLSIKHHSEWVNKTKIIFFLFLCVHIYNVQIKTYTHRRRN